MTSLRKISEVLGNVQASTVNNQKYLIILKKEYEKHEFDDFVKEFVRCLKHFLYEDTLKNQNHFADNGLEFCAMFSTSLKKDNTDQSICPFLKAIILKVLELHNVSQARYRVCFHINQLLQQVNKKDGHIDTAIYENIKEVMLERMQDVKSAVQIQAIEILGSLQDSENPNDPIINAYMKCLCDRNAQVIFHTLPCSELVLDKVRKTIIRCIGLNANTIPVLLKRCLDIDESVRHSAFEKISELPIRVLKIEQRQYILENGLKDKSEKVQTFIQKTLLSRWLSSYNGSYVELICALKLDADERDWKHSVKIVENTLNILFRSCVLKNLLEILPLGPDKLIPSNEVKWEQLIYWRCLSSFLQQNENTIDYLDEILPELSSFCKYILRVYKRRYTCTNEFEILVHGQIMHEVLKIAEIFDFSDEVGRINLRKLIKDMLIEAELSTDNVSVMVKILEHLYPSTEERTEEIVVIISEIRNPLVKQQLPDYAIRQQKVQVAKHLVELNITVDEQEQAIAKADFQSAEELQRKIEEIKTKIKCMTEEFKDFREVRIARTDSGTSSKCLDILIAFLSSATIKTLPAAIKTLQVEFVQPLLISTLPEIYLKAMHLYGLVCIVDKTLAQMSVGFFCEPLISYTCMAVQDEEKMLLAISCITDLLLMHGRNIVEPDDQNPSVSNCSTPGTDLPVPVCIANIIEVFSKMLDDASPRIRERSCEAIVKLMLHGVISSPILLCKLILKWFNPVTAKDVRLRQLLGCLFFEYVTEVPGSLEIVEDAFIPTLSSVVKAPRHSPLANVSIDSTLKFLIELSRPGRNKCNKKLNPHINISLLLCREICTKPNDDCAVIYLKALIMLETPTNDVIVLEKLRRHVDRMFQLIRDKTVLNYVRKYKNRLESDMEQTISTIDPKTANTSVLSKSMESNGNECSSKKPKHADAKGKYNNSKHNGHSGTVRGNGHENDRRQRVNSLDRTSVSAVNNTLETEHAELQNNGNYTPQVEKNIK